jgi:hypothetical protein
MPRLRRRWRVVKWGGLALSLIIAVAWVFSLRWFCVYARSEAGQGGSIYTTVGRGCLTTTTAVHPLPGFSGGWRLYRIPPGSLFLRWRTRILTENESWAGQVVHVSIVILPLWIPFLLVAIPTAFLWHRDRRRILPGHCQRCGYNLTGNVSGTCPECNTPVADEGRKP